MVGSIESQMTTKIENPNNLIQIGIIFKCIKAVMTIIIFTMNGVTNDYFVSVFFFTTSFCGLVYFSKAGYNMPYTPTADMCPDPEYYKVEMLRYKIEKDIIMK